jgi:UDP-N-acetylmuramate--alanine ligase
MRYHIVGIAGSGMSAIAHLLLDQGHTVSGSDVSANQLTAALSARGATIMRGHAAENLGDAAALVTTSAARPDHVELEAARARGVPVLKRADLWRDWSRQRPVIAVAGSHGKTTTSALIALGLRGAGLDAGFLIGAEIPDLGGNARWGAPAAPLVIEADEYDRAFLALTPSIAVITNIEWDHPDIYPTAEEYHAAFAQFAASLPDPRRLVLCGDDPGVMALSAPQAIFYGVDELIATDPASCRLAPLDWTASGLHATPGGTQFDLWRYDRRSFGTRRVGAQALRLYGTHSVSNALAALAVCDLLAVDLAAASAALASYGGAARRFEPKGAAGGVTVIDDYAHHPTEAKATIAGARACFPGRRLIVYLQPHTFSRTEALLDNWPAALAEADLTLIGDIYASRETGDVAELARRLAERVAAAGVQARYVGSLAAAATALAEQARPGDVVLTLGAGDGDSVGAELITLLHADDGG